MAFSVQMDSPTTDFAAVKVISDPCYYCLRASLLKEPPIEPTYQSAVNPSSAFSFDAGSLRSRKNDNS